MKEDNKTMYWSVTYNTPDQEETEEKDLTEKEMRLELQELKHRFKDDKFFLKMIEDMSGSGIGYQGQSHKGYGITISVYRKRIKGDESSKHMCGRRMGYGIELGIPFDVWDKVGADRVCSFCGSMHPEDLIALIRKDGLSVIEPSTKDYKWYIKQSDIHNAGQGAIKYYKQHNTEEFVKQYNELIKLHNEKRT